MVATPGRLLQHLDQTAMLNVSRIQMLGNFYFSHQSRQTNRRNQTNTNHDFRSLIIVLDEADRILDMGFEKEMNAILKHFKNPRQTLLFSATQTKSLKDLARLSLKEPEYISVHETTHVMPPQLSTSNI